jgi:hypothetical protein
MRFPLSRKISSVGKKSSGRSVSIVSRIKKSSGGDDSAGQCGATFQQTRTNLSAQVETLRRAAVSQRCRAALRRLAVASGRRQVGSILRRAHFTDHF